MSLKEITDSGHSKPLNKKSCTCKHEEVKGVD